MTYEEQADRLRMLWNIIGLDNKYLNESFTSAITLLEKAEKYRWHDLRKNPEDLPNKYECFFVAYDDAWAGIQYTTCMMGSWFWENHNVIAWRKIAPFEEGV